MSRKRNPERVSQLVAAAREVFSTYGYRHARMEEIAKGAGISPGLVYRYAEGKDALFRLVLLHELGSDLDTNKFPLAAPDSDDLRSLIRRALREVGTIEALNQAESVRSPRDAQIELAAIVGEHYDRVSRYRWVLRLLERSAADIPDLAASVYEHGRSQFVARLGRYISNRVRTGDFAPVPDPDVAARYLVEVVAWFANHRYGDHDGGSIDDFAARATVVQLVTSGLVAEP